MTEQQILINELLKIKSYPDSMQPLCCEIEGIGFFPGAKGLFLQSDTTISDKSIMILGHDFGAKKDFQNSVIRKEENQSIWMWKNLYEMFNEYSISKEDCFLTNAIMGARKAESATKNNPSYKEYPEFVSDCTNFLQFQISLQRPKKIFVLGKHLFSILSSISNNLKSLKEIKSFVELDEKALSYFKNISFPKIENYQTNIAFLLHPSNWHMNIGKRKFKNFKGREAEREIVQQI